MAEIRIPKVFYRDHVERDLPAPPVVRETERHYFIDPAHPDAAELLSDARYYADPNGPCTDIADRRDYMGLLSSARATARALAQPV